MAVYSLAQNIIFKIYPKYLSQHFEYETPCKKSFKKLLGNCSCISLRTSKAVYDSICQASKYRSAFFEVWSEICQTCLEPIKKSYLTFTQLLPFSTIHPLIVIYRMKKLVHVRVDDG